MHGMLQQHPLQHTMQITGRRQVLSELIPGSTAACKKECCSCLWTAGLHIKHIILIIMLWAPLGILGTEPCANSCNGVTRIGAKFPLAFGLAVVMRGHIPAAPCLLEFPSRPLSPPLLFPKKSAV